MRIRIFIFFLIILPASLHAQVTPWEASAAMRKGINLGNTLEPPNEAGWNNPKAQEYYFDLYKEAGFTCIRVPVRWDEHTGKTSPFKIDAAWLNRVEEILDWGLSRGLYVVVNAHHEDWIKSNYSALNRARFDSIWSQISTRFQNKSEKLLFEIINEPYGLTQEQNNDLHKRVLSIIRKTNPTRIVIFQGNNWGGAIELINTEIPADNYLMGSYHSYDPYLFGLEGQGTWGTSNDINQLKATFIAVKDWSVKNNIPVFLGEFGAVTTCDYNSRMRHYKSYVEFAKTYGFVACAWDDGSSFKILNRQDSTWNEIKDILIYSSAQSPVHSLQVYQDSIIKIVWNNKVADNDSIFIERRKTSENSYQKIASLPPGSASYLDIKPEGNNKYHYRVIAHYNTKEDVYSHPLSIFLPSYAKAKREPYLETPAEIPGTVEAEDYDKGGEGFTYHDSDSQNITGIYRPDEGVDIYDRLGAGYHIGNAIAGEWYEYSINVSTAGLYKIECQIAALSGGGEFKISSGDNDTGILKAPTSYSWLTTKSVSGYLELAAGIQIIRFSVVSSPLFNIDKMVFSLATSAGNLAIGEELRLKVETQKNCITLYFENGGLIKEAALYNLSGIQICRIQANSQSATFSAGKLPKGIYVARLNTGAGLYSKKIIFN